MVLASTGCFFVGPLWEGDGREFRSNFEIGGMVFSRVSSAGLWMLPTGPAHFVVVRGHRAFRSGVFVSVSDRQCACTGARATCNCCAALGTPRCRCRTQSSISTRDLRYVFLCFHCGQMRMRAAVSEGKHSIQTYG